MTRDIQFLVALPATASSFHVVQRYNCQTTLHCGSKTFKRRQVRKIKILQNNECSQSYSAWLHTSLCCAMQELNIGKLTFQLAFEASSNGRKHIFGQSYLSAIYLARLSDCRQKRSSH